MTTICIVCRSGECTCSPSSASQIADACDELKALLLAKNEAYGNSALNPMRVFSWAPIEEQILVRIDDKLSQLARGSAAGEDVVRDLIADLLLLQIARQR